MEKYVIYTDASADVDVNFMKANDVKFITMTYTMNDQEYTHTTSDDEGIFPFYERLQKGYLASTSQITPFIFEKIFKEDLQKGLNIIYLSLSSGLSSTYLASCIAKENLSKKYKDVKLYIVDSLGASASMGMLLDRMVRNKINGLTIDENIKDVEHLRSKLFTCCFVDNLMHLKRGGRISSTTAFLGTVLGIKPLIKITNDGKLENFGKQKGEHKAIDKLVEIFKEKYDDTSFDPIYISDAFNQKTADYLEAKIKEAFQNVVVKRMTLSPIIGTHVGPCSVVLSYKQK